MYAYVIVCMSGFFSGFCARSVCFSDTIRVVDEEHTSNLSCSLQNTTNRRYIRYLENLLNNSTDVSTESYTLNAIDASCNIVAPTTSAEIVENTDHTSTYESNEPVAHMIDR